METTSRSISFDVDYVGEETIRQILVGMKRITWYRRLLIGPQLLISFIFFIAALYFFVGLSAVSVLLAAALAIVVRGFLSLYVFEWISWVGVYLEKRYKDITNGIAPTLLTKFEFSDRGITVDHLDQNCIKKYSHYVTKWSAVFEAIETESDLIIFYDDGGAYLFPKRIFQEFDEMNSFKTFITQKIGNRAIF